METINFNTLKEIPLPCTIGGVEFVKFESAVQVSATNRRPAALISKDGRRFVSSQVKKLAGLEVTSRDASTTRSTTTSKRGRKNYTLQECKQIAAAARDEARKYKRLADEAAARARKFGKLAWLKNKSAAAAREADAARERAAATVAKTGDVRQALAELTPQQLQAALKAAGITL